jgi:uncharacterized protein YkwD
VWYYLPIMKAGKVVAIVLITWLIFALFWLFVAGAFLLWATKDKPSPSPVATQSLQGLISFDQSPYVDLNSVYSLVNTERSKLGLSVLINDPLIALSAQEKCADMVAKDYWSHNAPDGTTPWEFIKRHNVYRTAGENLAYGFKTPDAVVKGWMASPGHKKNIVNPLFNRVGYAECEYPKTSKEGENTLVVQMFTD